MTARPIPRDMAAAKRWAIFDSLGRPLYPESGSRIFIGPAAVVCEGKLVTYPDALQILYRRRSRAEQYRGAALLLGDGYKTVSFHKALDAQGQMPAFVRNVIDSHRTYAEHSGGGCVTLFFRDGAGTIGLLPDVFTLPSGLTCTVRASGFARVTADPVAPYRRAAIPAKDFAESLARCATPNSAPHCMKVDGVGPGRTWANTWGGETFAAKYGAGNWQHYAAGGPGTVAALAWAYGMTPWAFIEYCRSNPAAAKHLEEFQAKTAPSFVDAQAALDAYIAEGRAKYPSAYTRFAEAMRDYNATNRAAKQEEAPSNFPERIAARLTESVEKNLARWIATANRSAAHQFCLRHLFFIQPSDTRSQQHPREALYLACKLPAEYGITGKDALALMRAYNLRCYPMWRAADLRRNLDLATKSVKQCGAFGRLAQRTAERIFAEK